MNKIDFADSSYVMKNMVKCNEKVYLISCINYEERSTAFAKSIAAAYTEEGCEKNLIISSWRLKSVRSHPWSLMEERKKYFIDELRQLCKNGITLYLDEIEWIDIRNETDTRFINEKIEKPSIEQDSFETKEYNLIVDLSAMPYDICYKFSEVLAKIDITVYKSIHIVYTSAKEYLSRKGLGPSQVGVIDIPRVTGDGYAMVFPGREGSEAAHAIAKIKEIGSHATVAINMFEPDVLNALDICYANQLVCTESFSNLSYTYYYSQQDVLRILAEFSKNATSAGASHIEFAVFDINWRVICIAFEAARLAGKVKQVSIIKYGNIANSNTHQYHNFYSVGIGPATMLAVSAEKTHDEIGKEIDAKKARIKRLFDRCKIIVVGDGDTIWHESKYFYKYKESVFTIIKGETNKADIHCTTVKLNEMLDLLTDGNSKSDYVNAMNSLCKRLNLSGQAIKDVEKLSCEFINGKVSLFCGAKRALIKIAKNRKCVIVTKADTDNFKRTRAAANLGLDFIETEHIDKKNTDSWEKLNKRLASENQPVLYIGNSYKEDIEPHLKLNHYVIWYDHKDNIAGRRGAADAGASGVLRIRSWDEIVEAIW